jgi:peptide/nickel transport system permease protein
LTETAYPAARSPAKSGRVRSVGASIWLRFFLRRLLGLVTVLASLVVAVFLMVHLIPGDPVTAALSIDTDPALIEQIRHANGFDQPIGEQFVTYVRHLAHGDLGRAFNTNQPVSDTIKQRIGSSLQLAAASLVIVLVFGISLGMMAGALTREGRHRRFEQVWTAVSAVFASIPDYLLATVLAFIFAVHFRWLPVAGSGSFRQLILPALAVALGPTMTLARLVRLETLNVLAQDYIRMARSQHLPPHIIYGRHVLPNVVTAAFTIGGVLFAHLVGGAVIVENVFNRPGLGTALVGAVTTKQYVVVQGIALFLGIVVVVVNTFVDVTLAILDPRSLAKKS